MKLLKIVTQTSLKLKAFVLQHTARIKASSIYGNSFKQTHFLKQILRQFFAFPFFAFSFFLASQVFSIFLFLTTLKALSKAEAEWPIITALGSLRQKLYWL